MADDINEETTNGDGETAVVDNFGNSVSGDDRKEAALLPDSLIVTNLDEIIFEDADLKAHFENLFRIYDDNACFQYLKSFRRARVNYSSPLTAAEARLQLHETEVGGKQMKCFFAQPRSGQTHSSNPHLEPPQPSRQYLISPPASPPEGWEPQPETQPVINYDLLTAIANLSPGEAHELHPPSHDQPGIVVHPCEDPEGYKQPVLKPKISHTPCPKRKT